MPGAVFGHDWSLKSNANARRFQDVHGICHELNFILRNQTASNQNILHSQLASNRFVAVKFLSIPFLSREFHLITVNQFEWYRERFSELKLSVEMGNFFCTVGIDSCFTVAIYFDLNINFRREGGPCAQHNISFQELIVDFKLFGLSSIKYVEMTVNFMQERKRRSSFLFTKIRFVSTSERSSPSKVWITSIARFISPAVAARFPDLTNIRVKDYENRVPINWVDCITRGIVGRVTSRPVVSFAANKTLNKRLHFDSILNLEWRDRLMHQIPSQILLSLIRLYWAIKICCLKFESTELRVDRANIIIINWRWPPFAHQSFN